MDILKQIISRKRIQVAQRKEICSHSVLLQQLPQFKPYSLVESLRSSKKNGIIAEFKRQSPSRGVINSSALVREVVSGYERAKVSAVSILTDTHFFGGSLFDLVEASQVLGIPILRKEFIVDEYQILEARVHGASAILLIASVLSVEEIRRFTSYAHELDLQVLFESHSKEEILKGDGAEIDVYGINNRNLSTFDVDVMRSINLYPFLPNNKPAVSESGISDVQTIKKLKEVGFSGFLIGENFMKTTNPSNACIDFSNQLMM